MQSFKQFIYEKESIDESKLTRGVAKAALGASIIGGIQAGAMHHTELPSLSNRATSVEKRDTPRGVETVTMHDTDAESAEKGNPTYYSHKGVFDLKPRKVVDTATGKPPESSFSIIKQGPGGNVGTYTQQGNRVKWRGSTDFSTPAKKNSDGWEISGPTEVSTNVFANELRGEFKLTKPASPGEQALGFVGTAAGLAALGAAARRRRS